MKLLRKQPPVDIVFRAFADPTRLRILHLLRGGEVCVCDLVGTIGVPQPKISRHLAYLRRAGLVSIRKQGLWSYYTLAPARSTLHRQLLACLNCCTGEVPELEKDATRLKVLCCNSDCCS